jgi:signal transduction histidine kinase
MAWAENKNIRLKVSVAKMPHMEIDSGRIYQVISNLISNALKFTPAAGKVEVKAELEEKGPNSLVKVTVVDSGIGINKDDLERIFEKYEQLKAKSSSSASGLGLGLSICKTIVELHNGKIWVQSKQGKGSSFIFTLPL